MSNRKDIAAERVGRQERPVKRKAACTPEPAGAADPVANPVAGRAAAHADFVCEEISPAAGTAAASMMARGEPGLPARFTWHGDQYEVIGVIETWKTSGPCRHGSGEMYLRRHWYKIQAHPLGGELAGQTHRVMTVYCDRQAKNRRRPKSRWWLYTVET